MGTLYIYEGAQALTPPQTNIQGGSKGTSGGTGGPGGGGGGGGAGGTEQINVSNNTGFYQVGAFGGNPGANGDGSFTIPAGYGANTLLNNSIIDSEHSDNLSQFVPWSDALGETSFENNGWKNGDDRTAGGSGGGCGSASTSGTANTVTAGWPTQGKGIEDAPFIVSSTDDWNEFANYVNSGYAFSGNFVKLGDDVSVSTMAGTSDANSFQGTFDGDGQTLTFTKGTSAEPFAEEYCAPFRHVKNAVIKNLHVAGTIYTSAKKAAGFVGESHGALTLTGCISSVNINSNVSGDGTHGGLVSTLSGENNAITIEGCVFDGSFATTNGTTNCGGFIGWGVYNKPTIKNSLMKPGSVAAGMLNSTFARWYTGNEGIYEPTIDNCYYVATDNLPTDQGTPAVVSLPDVGSLVQEYGIVKAYEHGIYYGGTYYLDPDKLSGYKMLNTATAEDVGKVVCAAGHLHDAKTPVPEGCTAVGILGKVTSTGHGLILALQDATPQTWETINGWETVSGYAGTTLKLLPDDAARGSLASYTLLGVVEVSDWCVAQKGDYETIFANIGTNAFITSAGGTALSSEGYWSASMSNERAWFVKNNYWNYSPRQTEHYVRPVLGFAASAITVTLADNADNSTTISSVNGCVADVTLSGRTLYKDGAWNTICLPFTVAVEGSPLDGATARPLTSGNISDNTLNLVFGDVVEVLEAGTPYIIKWDSGDDIVSPVFYDVVIDAAAKHDYDNEASGNNRVRFIGTYNAMTFTADNQYNILLIEGDTSNNTQMARDTNSSIRRVAGDTTLRYVGDGSSISACQAYFKIGDDDTPPTSQLTGFNVYFGEPDGINAVSSDTSAKGRYTDNNWYSIDGRKLQGKPNVKGVYINGKTKIVIK